MARKQEKAPVAPETILIGPCQISKTWLETSFPPGFASKEDFRQSGVTCVDEKQKHTIKIGDMPVQVSITLTIVREPVGQEEVNACDAKRDDYKKKKDLAEQEAQEALAKEKRAMFALGQQSSTEAVFGTLSQMDKLVAVGNMVNKLTKQNAAS